MILRYTLHRMHLHINFLPRPQLIQHDVPIGRGRNQTRRLEDGCLLACGFPFEVRREDFVVCVEFEGVGGVFWGGRVALADDVEFEDDGVAVGRLVVDCENGKWTSDG